MYSSVGLCQPVDLRIGIRMSDDISEIVSCSMVSY